MKNLEKDIDLDWAGECQCEEEYVCKSACQKSCQNCLGQCETACQKGCQCSSQGCQTCLTCQSDCEHPCEHGCQGDCQTGCQCTNQGCQDCLGCENCECATEVCQTCQIGCQIGCECILQNNQTPTGTATITNPIITKTSISLTYKASGSVNQIEAQCTKVSDGSSAGIKENNVALNGTTTITFTGLIPSTSYKIHTIIRNNTSYIDSYENTYTTNKPIGTLAGNGYSSDSSGQSVNVFYKVTGDIDKVDTVCKDMSGNIVSIDDGTVGAAENVSIKITGLNPNTSYSVFAQASYLGIPVATLATEIKTSNPLEITKLEIADIPDLGIGETYQLIPIFTPPNTISKSVIYEITDKTIVDRDTRDGNIKALKPGTTYIKASSSQRPNLSVTKAVTVKPTGTISISNIRKTAVSISFDVITTGNINKIFAHSYDKEMEAQSKYTEDENHKIIEKFTNGKTSITFDGLEPDTEHRIEIDAAFNGYNVFDPNNKQIAVKCIIDTIKTDKFVPVTGISFEVPSIKTEQTVALKGDVIPYNATLNSMTFSTDNTTIASVENGVLKANKAGVCNIIAISKEYSRRKINCPSIKVSKKLIVQPGGTITLLSHTKDDDSISLVYKTTGDTNKIKASCVNSSTNESQKPIEINANGQTTITFNNLKANTAYKITAVAYMNTTILSSTPTTIKTSIINVTDITFEDIPTLSVGKNYTLIASVSPPTATDKRIEFLTSNSDIASINNGILTAKVAGNCTITARAVSSPNISISKQLLILPVSNSNVCTIDITSPGSGSQFDFLEDLMVKANISNSPDEVYFCYAANEDDKYRKGTLKKLENSSYEKNGEIFNTYFGYWKPLPSNSKTSRKSEWVKGQLSKAADDKYVWHMPKITVKAVKKGSVSQASIPAYLHCSTLEEYKAFLKPNIDFNLERDIVGVATSYGENGYLHNSQNTYNCVAYAVGIYNKWQEPFRKVSKSNLKKYIEEDVILYNGKKYGSVEIIDVSYGKDGDINNINSNFKTRIIYYAGDHFAKVLTYDKNGNPKKIRSKWSSYELVDSPNPNPFSNTDFGNAKYLISSSAAIKEFNDYHKEYYNATDFIWDNVNKRYIDKDFYPLGTSNSFIGIPIKDYRYQWLENNKDSQNPLDKAIIQYCEESKLDTSLVRKAYYSPQDDKQLHIITDLGIQCVPEMLDKTKTNHPFSGLLMTAIEEITKISPELVDVSNDGINKWVAALNNIIIKAPITVKDTLELLNSNTDEITVAAVKKDISIMGILSIPYIIENKSTEAYRLMNMVTELYGQNTINFYSNNSDNMNELIVTVKELYTLITKEDDSNGCGYQCERLSESPCKDNMACHGCLSFCQNVNEVI